MNAQPNVPYSEDMTQLRGQIEIEEIRARINKMMAETTKIQAESRWYPWLVIVGGLLAVAAAIITKL